MIDMCVKVRVIKHSIVYRGKPKTNKNGAFEMPRELAEKLISNGAHIEIIDSEENDSAELTYAIEENNSEENNDTEETVIIEENNDNDNDNDNDNEENNDIEEKPKKKRRKKK
jgi:hypothetical protein